MQTPTWLRVALPSALGALIGTLSALGISTRFEYGTHLWIIGALIGGALAYVANDYRHFWAGIRHSYRRTIDWRPDGLWWKALWVTNLSFLSSSFLPIMIFILIFDGVMAVISEGKITMSALPVMMVVWLMFYIVISLVGVCTFSMRDREKGLNFLITMMPQLTRQFNPMSQIIWTCRLAARSPSAIVFVFHATFNGVRRAGQRIVSFGPGVILFVHTKQRTICLLAAALGTMIGFPLGNAIAGLVAGGLLGILFCKVAELKYNIVPASR